MRWKPLTLDFLLEKHGLNHLGFVSLLGGWILFIAFCLFMVLSIDIEQAGFAENLSAVLSTDYLMFQIPVWLGVLLVFWLGFEWGFIPVFLYAVIMAFGFEMNPIWAILYGLSFVLGLAIYALAYFCVPADIRLKSLKSIAFFTVVSVVASLAGSLGSFIWSTYYNFGIGDVMVIWKRWWTGMFLGSVFFVGPLLYLFSSKIDKLKKRFFANPPEPNVSISWIYSTIASVAAVLILFILSVKSLATQSLFEFLPDGSDVLILNLQGANESFAMVTWISIGLVLVTSVTGIYLMGNWNRRLKEKVDEQTLELSHKEKMLREALENRDELLDEIHDRIRYNLTIVLALLELQLKNDSEKSAETMLKDSHSRIQSMAIIHETMAATKSVSRVNIKNYVFKLSNRLQRVYKEELPDVDISIRADDVMLDLNRAFPCAIILNELVVNAYEHAFATGGTGQIIIEIRNDNGQMNLRISDTGKGLPKDFNMMKRDTLGLKLVRTLTRELGADFRIEDYDTSTFLLEIPHYEKKFNLN